MRSALVAVVAVALAACGGSEPEAPETPAWNTRDGGPPQVIAHRGASGERPEHTVGAYILAINQGADVIEPDLHMSGDGRLIVRHDGFLSRSTDIARRARFAERRRELKGREDWWIHDFTARELGTLRARQTENGRSAAYDGQYGVMTFDAFLDLIAEAEAECGCTIGIAPEVKHPAEYAAMGLDPLPALLAALSEHYTLGPDAPVVVQSFDPDFLRRLDSETDLRLAMLYAGPGEDGANAGGLSLPGIAQFADIVAPNKAVLFDRDGESTGYVARAHAAGLDVHAWTVRDDRAPWVGDTVEDELRALYDEGVDAVFADFPETALAVREDMAGE
ncbi:glycerophosphodiester phosphodiesterase family protein [Marinicauda salina]|nr:glycerophosphodiester phosphodiesterase family protein [Marinicauda salina]